MVALKVEVLLKVHNPVSVKFEVVASPNCTSERRKVFAEPFAVAEPMVGFVGFAPVVVEYPVRMVEVVLHKTVPVADTEVTKLPATHAEPAYAPKSPVESSKAKAEVVEAKVALPWKVEEVEISPPVKVLSAVQVVELPAATYPGFVQTN